jgi:hypothetical protein
VAQNSQAPLRWFRPYVERPGVQVTDDLITCKPVLGERWRENRRWQREAKATHEQGSGDAGTPEWRRPPCVV